MGPMNGPVLQQPANPWGYDARPVLPLHVVEGWLQRVRSVARAARLLMRREQEAPSTFPTLKATLSSASAALRSLSTVNYQIPLSYQDRLRFHASVVLEELRAIFLLHNEEVRPYDEASERVRSKLVGAVIRQPTLGPVFDQLLRDNLEALVIDVGTGQVASSLVNVRDEPVPTRRGRRGARR